MSTRQGSTRQGTLWGVGLGPGDPELVTVKAARVIGAADVVAYHSARHGRSIARGIAEPYLRDGQIEEHLVYPVTTETSDHPGGYTGAMEDFYRESADRIAAHLDAGRDVALLAEGDPLFYSSYMHMHTRLTQRFDAVIVPGVTSVSAASAAVSTPLVQGDQVLTILPGTLPQAELQRRLADTDAAVILKLGRVLRRARQHRTAAGAARRRCRRRIGAVLRAGDAHRRRAHPRGHRLGRGGRARPRRHRVDDAAEPPRARRGDRPDRVRPVPGPGRGPRRAAQTSVRQHRRTRAGPAGM